MGRQVGQGSAGVAQFFLDLHLASGNTHYLAQTGYMQGAAGIGMWLLRLDAVGKKRTNVVHFPDTPF